MAAAKDELRAQCTASRRARSAGDRETARAAVRARVLDRCRTLGWGCVAAYVPFASEPGSIELLDGLLALGVRVIVPVTQPDRDLDWTPWPSRTTALGRDAIRATDAVLVPALAVDHDGARLGRGGGSYDRALARLAPGTLTVALLFDEELLPSLPADPWDVPVSAAVSPARWTLLGTDGRNTGVGRTG